MRFFKYHGAGNDFIIIDNRNSKIPESEKESLAIRLCDRHFGIGSDGLILGEKSVKSDIRMRIFNPDGSEAEMCGNGIRCLARFFYEKINRKRSIQIESLVGVKNVEVTLETGHPRFFTVAMGYPSDIELNKTLKKGHSIIEYSSINTGVPHAVLFVEDLDNLDIKEQAPLIRFHSVFPKGANVNFVEKMGKNRFKIRTYERGVENETLACGTGITASGIIALLLGLADSEREVEFHAKGGIIFVSIDTSQGLTKAFMRGPVEFVFKGDIQL